MEAKKKMVLQSIPTYYMSTFLLPSTLGDEIQRMVNSFWWGTNRGTVCGNLWMNCDRLTLRKEFGGIGFLHLYGFDLAMLGKEGRRLLTNQDTIASRVFKTRYFTHCDFLGASLDHNPSYDCRRIYTSQVVVKGSLRW